MRGGGRSRGNECDERVMSGILGFRVRRHDEKDSSSHGVDQDEGVGSEG